MIQNKFDTDSLKRIGSYKSLICSTNSITFSIKNRIIPVMNKNRFSVPDASEDKLTLCNSLHKHTHPCRDSS